MNLNLSRQELALWAGALLLLAVAIVRLAVPDRSRIRPLSLEGFEIPSETIDQGQTLTRERSWDPPTDVYIMGWSPRIMARGSGATLQLMAGDVRLFEMVEGSAEWGQGIFPDGAGFLLRKGQKLVLRFRIINGGTPVQTLGANALVYFVPAEGN